MENNQIKYIVYCTICTDNKKIYVGVHKTINPEIFDGYIGNGVYINKASTYEHPKHKFQFAVKKHGPKKFIRNIIKIFDNEEEAFNLEAEIVNEEFLKRTDVYNVSLGGRNANIPDMSYKTYQYDINGNYLKTYSSIKEASLSIGRNLKTIWRAIKDKSRCAECYWTTLYFEKLDLSKMKLYSGLHTIPVFQYSKTGEYDCCYESVSDAGRVLNIHSANISRAIKLGTICEGKYFLTEYAPSYDVAKSNNINSSPIYQYGLDGMFIAEFKNMQDAKNKLGIKTNIYSAIKLGQTCGGYLWSFEKLSNIAPAKPKAGRARKVGKYDKNWNLIKIYNTLAACKKENGSGMQHVLSGRDEFAKGFRYKYLDD